MKKRIIAIVLALGSFSTVAFADITAKTDNRNGTVSVSGKTSPNTTVTLTVKSSDDGRGLYAVKETVSNDEGDYSFNFKLRQRETVQDEYKYTMSIKGDGVYCEDLTVYSDTIIDNFKTDITSGNLQSVLDDPSKTGLAKVFGLDIEGYEELKALSYGDEVVAAFNVDAANDNLTNDDIADIFNMEIVLYRSKLADNAGFVKLLGSDFTERKLSSFTKQRLYETKAYRNIKEYEQQILMFETLNKVNSANFSQLEALFEANKTILTLNTTDEYNIYTNWDSAAEKKRKANESIVTLLLNNPAKTTGDFITVFKTAVINANKTNPQGGGGSSFGGGGSSGGGSSSGRGGSTGGKVSIVISDSSENVLPEKEKVFADVEIEFWAEDDIRNLAEAKIINGYEDNTFRPNNSITREEFVTILVKAFNLNKSGAACEFEDVGKNVWFYQYIASAFENKVVSGVSEKHFGAGQNITRQDVAVMIARIINTTVTNAEQVFADDNLIADYAREAVYGLRKAGVINGKTGNLFDPHEVCTRAECATMIRKAMNLK